MAEGLSDFIDKSTDGEVRIEGLSDFIDKLTDEKVRSSLSEEKIRRLLFLLRFLYLRMQGDDFTESRVKIRKAIEEILGAYGKDIPEEALFGFDRLNNPERGTGGKIPVIGIVGKISSGKETVAKIIGKLVSQEDCSTFHIPFSAVMRDIAGFLAPGKEPNRDMLVKIAGVLKPKLGKDVFVDATLRALRFLSEAFPDIRLGIVDGFRSVKETELFLSQLDTYIIGVVASHDPEEDLEIRFKRQKKRGRGREDVKDFEKFRRLNEREDPWIDPILGLIESRGFPVIINNAELDDLKIAVSKALDTLRSRYGFPY